MGERLDYILSGLLCLNSPDDSFQVTVNGRPKTVTYREATDALAQVINVTRTGAANA
jgi:hypothetical protein